MSGSVEHPGEGRALGGPLTRAGRLVADHRLLLGVAAAVVGVLVGAAAVLFDAMIRGWTRASTGFEEYTRHIGQDHGLWGWPAWVVLLLSPVAAALVYGPLVQRFAPSARGHGIPEVMLAVRRKGGRIPGRIAVVKLIASSLTIGAGGSAGREGPIVQVGASLGSALATRLGLPTSRIVLLASCGAAGGIAATFHAPLAGAVFALEVILTRFTAESFGFVVVSAVTASVVARAVQGDEVVIAVAGPLEFSSLTDMWWVALLGLVAGLTGLGFSKLLYLVEDGIDAVWTRTGLPEWSRPAVLGIGLGAGLVAFPHMYGSGYPLEEAALAGEYSVGFLLLLMAGRALYTSYTIGIGGSGGVFAPTLFIGAMAGAAYGRIIDPVADSYVGVFGVIGMGAAFAGAARAPMTAVLIIVEMTGQFSLIMPMMLAVVVATGASRFLTRSTIYTEKLRRRGDVLDDPVEGTLLGAKPVAQWMGPVPEALDSSLPLSAAVEALRRTREPSLPVVDGSGAFVGTISALDAAVLRHEDASANSPLAELPLGADAARESDGPATVLERLRRTGLTALPVLGEDRRVVGWVSQRDLVDRMYRDQRRAIDARRQSSWGSRFQERHRPR
ncbi:chloride channel protein [Actinomyces sp. B33]|uniref:chloride channel protein n=1 Tax=Actinomyces sp. B33 TaxID=2942131 RepID=UPI00233FBE26|nr:chloride channel protein [Actinomyces sp. B33]MDC4233197.1 chloride channel protein [Actinomyces sp. B33]